MVGSLRRQLKPAVHHQIKLTEIRHRPVHDHHAVARMERESSKRETESLELELDALPDELLLEILARVPSVTSNSPAKAAADLRAVSRRWNSIVSSGYYFPRFISLGEENNRPWGNGEALLFCYILRDPTRATVPLFYMLPSQCDPEAVIQSPALDFGYISYDGRRHFVIAASEDLLLLTKFPYSIGPLVVCNPFTKRWVTLPHPPPPRWSSFRDFMIVCHPQGNRYRVVSKQLPGVLEDVFFFLISRRFITHQKIHQRCNKCTTPKARKANA